MVKITNGVNIFEVSKGAYEGIYKKQGYEMLEKAEVKKGEEKTKAPEVSEEQAFCDEIMEKPISQWNKDEVKKFAEINSIDIAGTKNANEAKERIKAYLG